MLRTFGTSIVIALLIAVVLSYLPTMEMPTQKAEMAVFNPDRPTELSEQTLVDFLQILKSEYRYDSVRWDPATGTLAVDFMTPTVPAKEKLSNAWFQFVQDTFQLTNNVQILTCQLIGEDDELFASMTAEKPQAGLSKPRKGKMVDYLTEHFHLRFH